MAPPTTNSGHSGSRKSTEVKSAVPDAASGSRQGRRGTSDTTTSTRQSGPDQSIAPATERRPVTAPNDADHVLDDPSPTGGPGSHVQIVSVFGAFATQCLVALPVSTAIDLFGPEVMDARRSAVLDGTERDIEDIRSRDAKLAESGLAGTALALAFEIEHPFNSATSKSMCAKALLDTMDRLRELCPPEQKADGIDELRDNVRSIRTGKSAATP